MSRPKTITRKGSARRSQVQRRRPSIANESPSFQDINPRFPPVDVKPVEPVARNQKPDLKSTARRPGSAAVQYPAPTPPAPPMRTLGEDSISTERVTLSVRMRFNPLRGLTPDRLVQYLEQFNIGFFRMAAMTWDTMEKRNSRLKAVVPKRKKAVSRHGWEVLTIETVPDGMEELANQQKDDLTYFYNNLTATEAINPDNQGGLSLLTRQMMDAQCKYYAVHEIVWQPSDKGLTAQFVFCPLWWFEGVTGKLRYLDNEFQVYGRDMDPAEWLITCGEGLMEAASVCYIFLSLTLNDWLTYCEKFGLPFLDAATSASPGSPEWEALKGYVENFGPDGGGVRSNNATIVPLMPNGSSSVDTFKTMVEHMATELTILFRGNDLGTHSKANSVGANVQQGEGDILETDDCVLVEETLATKVSRFVISWKHGPDVPVLAYLKFNRADKKDTDAELKVDEFLAGLKDQNGRGVLAVQATLERYGRSMPEDDDDVFEVAAPPGKLPDPGVEDPAFANAYAGKPVAPEIVKHFADALAEDLQPLRSAIAAIENIADPELFRKKLEEFISDHGPLVKLLADINAYPKSAKIIAETNTQEMATALAKTTP
jgi:phage gp29-like protein